MNIEPLKLPGCFWLHPKAIDDKRGSFIKTFVAAQYHELHLPIVFEEEYYTRSVKHALRGIHFQTPPYEYCKLVTCLYGRIRDVIVDLRVGSPQFRKHEMIELDEEKNNVLYLSPGIAHGFLVLSEMALVAYKVTSPHAPANDTGIRWDSIGVDWGIESPIVSPRDASFQRLEEFESPFTYTHEETGS